MVDRAARRDASCPYAIDVLCFAEMTGGNLFGAVMASLVCPGFGHGLAFHRNRMLAWALAGLATTLPIIWSVWFAPIMLAVRLGAAVDTYRVVKRHTPPGSQTLAIVAVVVGIIGVAYVRIVVEQFKIPSSSMYPTLMIGDHIYVDKLSKQWRPVERGELIVFMQPCARVPYIKRAIAVGGDTVEVRCSVVYVNGKAIEGTLVDATASYADRDDHDGRWLTRETSRYRESHGGHTYDVFHTVERPAHDKAGGRADPHDFPRLERLIAPSCQQGDWYEPKGTPQPVGTLVQSKPDAGACEPQVHFVVPRGALFMMGDNRNNANDSRYWGAVSEDAVIGRVIGIWLSGAQVGRFSRFGAIE